MNRFVCMLDMQCVLIRIGIHGNGRDAELFAGTHDADGDLAPVGNEDFIDHFV